LDPHLLSDSLLDSLMNVALKYRDRIDPAVMLPRINWREPHNERASKDLGSYTRTEGSLEAVAGAGGRITAIGAAPQAHAAN